MVKRLGCARRFSKLRLYLPGDWPAAGVHQRLRADARGAALGQPETTANGVDGPLFGSKQSSGFGPDGARSCRSRVMFNEPSNFASALPREPVSCRACRSEEHTSELQSPDHL